MAKEKKRKSIARLMEEAATLLQKLVKVKAADREGVLSCITCGRRLHWTEADGGHFVSRRWVATKLLEQNVHPQCRPCNHYLRGNLISYTTYLIDLYGRDFVDNLQRKKHEPTKWSRPDLEDLMNEYRGRIAEIMTEKGL